VKFIRACLFFIQDVAVNRNAKSRSFAFYAYWVGVSSWHHLCSMAVAMKEKLIQWTWFIGGFAVGFSLILASQAALPTTGQRATEIVDAKLPVPELSAEFSKLKQAESRYVESSAQQKKLSAAVKRNAARARK